MRRLLRVLLALVGAGAFVAASADPTRIEALHGLNEGARGGASFLIDPPGEWFANLIRPPEARDSLPTLGDGRFDRFGEALRPSGVGHHVLINRDVDAVSVPAQKQTGDAKFVAVPEPATSGLLLLGMLVMLGMTRGRTALRAAKTRLTGA